LENLQFLCYHEIEDRLLSVFGQAAGKCRNYVTSAKVAPWSSWSSRSNKELREIMYGLFSQQELQCPYRWTSL